MTGINTQRLNFSASRFLQRPLESISAPGMFDERRQNLTTASNTSGITNGGGTEDATPDLRTIRIYAARDMEPRSLRAEGSASHSFNMDHNTYK